MRFYLLFLAALLGSALVGCVDPSVDPVANDDDVAVDDDDDSVVNVDTVTFAFSASDADGVSLDIQVFLGDYENPTPASPTLEVDADGEWSRVNIYAVGFAPRPVYVCALSASEAYMAYGNDDTCGNTGERNFVEGVVVVEESLDYNMGTPCHDATVCNPQGNAQFDEWEITVNQNSSWTFSLNMGEYVPGLGTLVTNLQSDIGVYMDGYNLHGMDEIGQWVDADIVNPDLGWFEGTLFDSIYENEYDGERQ